MSANPERRFTAGPESGKAVELAELDRQLRRLAAQLIADPASADDLVQDAWVAALGEDRNTIRHYSSWMRSVVQNLLRRSQSRERRRKDVESLVALRDDEAFESEIDERTSTHRMLRSLVNGLGEPGGRVLDLHYFEGLTLADVASRLDRPLATVRTQHRRALADLREALDREHRGDRSSWMLWLSGTIRKQRRQGTGLAARIGLVAAVLVVATWLWVERPSSADAVVVRADSPSPSVSTPSALAPSPESGTAGTTRREIDETATSSSASIPPDPPPAVLPRTRRLEVRVVTLEGVPVQGAIVTATVSLALPDIFSPPTDADGLAVFELDPETLMRAPMILDPAGGACIRAKATGHAFSDEYYIVIPENGRAFELRLAGPEEVLDILVVDEENAPVRDALVEVDKRRRGVQIDEDGTKHARPAVGATTGADGRARVTNLQAAEHEVFVKAKGFVRGSTRVPSATGTSSVTIALSRGGIAAGRVVRRNGALVSDAIVAAPEPKFHREEPARVRTDARGEFRLTGLEPTIPVRLFAYTSLPSDGFADVVVEPKADGSTWTEIVLELREPLRVHIEDNSGRPLAGGMVQWSTRAKSGPLWRTMSVLDDAGEAVLAHYPSQLLQGIVFEFNGGRSLATIAFEPGDLRDLRLCVARDECEDCAKLSLTVLDHRGAPLHGALLVAAAAGEARPSGWLFDPANGKLTARKVTPGTWHGFVVAREGALDLGQITLTQKGETKLGTLSCGLPGSIEFSFASKPPTASRLSIYFKAPEGIGFVRDLALDAGATDLLPLEYEVRVESEVGNVISKTSFTVTSGVTTRVVIP